MKKFGFMLIILAFSLLGSGQASAKKDISVMINGKTTNVRSVSADD